MVLVSDGLLVLIQLLHLSLQQFLETEVVLVVEVGLDESGWNLPVVHAQSLRGHQLHDPLAQVADQPVGQHGHHHASIGRDLASELLHTLGKVKNVECFHHGLVDHLCGLTVGLHAHEAEDLSRELGVEHNDLHHLCSV